MSKTQRLILATLILGAGSAILAALILTKPEPEKAEPREGGVLVETQRVEERSERVRVSATGTVVPAREIVLSPEVSGRVVWLSDSMVPGGRVQAGEALIRIDARDYALAAQEAYAAVDRARTELRLEESRKKVAEREWELFGPDDDTGAAQATEAGPAGGADVALREPQMRAAKTAVKAAESSLQRAELAVAKATMKAPFNAMIRDQKVDLGQLVAPSAQLASLVGTDAFWVQVSVPMDDLGWIQIPGVGSVAEGQDATATIVQNVAGQRVLREGRVIKLLGDVDPVGRMARLLVEIEDPLGLGAPAGDPRASLPLLLGSYVEVEIVGSEVAGVVVLPRVALREGNKVFVRAADDTLDIRVVQVAWRRSDEVLVSSGLESGDEVIVTPIGAPVNGLKLRVSGTRSAPAAAASGPSKAEEAAVTP